MRILLESSRGHSSRGEAHNLREPSPKSCINRRAKYMARLDNQDRHKRGLNRASVLICEAMLRTPALTTLSIAATTSKMSETCFSGLYNIDLSDETGLVCSASIRTSWTSISPCCVGEASVVSDNCTQFCVVDGDSSDFDECYRDLTNGTYAAWMCREATDGMYTTLATGYDSTSTEDDEEDDETSGKW